MFRDDKFSLWCDFIEKDFIESEFVDLIKNSTINGATSNPAIFKNAMSNSEKYNKTNLKYRSKKECYEILATQDIRCGAEKLLLNYVKLDDGFISIEVDPNLADDEKATVDEAKRLYSAIGMPNVMIKIPATKSGFGAMKKLISKGININATLIFSPQQVSKCLKAFEKGTYEFKKRFPKANLPKAVISIFVSRFDTYIKNNATKIYKGNKRLNKEQILNLANELTQNRNNEPLLGIYNAMNCYNLIEEASLENVKALFASTGTKDKSLSADYYVKSLMFKNSINTAPLATIKEFIKNSHNIVDSKDCNQFIKRFSKNFDIQKIYSELLDDGLSQFCKAFKDILQTIK